jgi:hypothetical protein
MASAKHRLLNSFYFCFDKGILVGVVFYTHFLGSNILALRYWGNIHKPGLWEMRFYHPSNIIFMTAIKRGINLIKLRSNNAKIRERAIREHCSPLNFDKIASKCNWDLKQI